MELELKRLELQVLKARNESDESIARREVEWKSLRMKDLMAVYRKGEDIDLFLVNFERTCEKAGFTRTWPQCLLPLLPGEAVDVIILSKEDADYDKGKSSLLKKYRLLTEAFRQKFCNAKEQRRVIPRLHIQTYG